jgi:hypothetical protein
MGPGARPIHRTQAPPSPGLDPWGRISYKVNVDPEQEYLTLDYGYLGKTKTYRLSFNTMPLTDFRKWILYGGPQRAYASGVQVINTIHFVESSAARFVTRREAEGLAYLSSKRSLYGITGSLTGTIAGCIIAYRSRDKMKFPFRAAQPLERYNNFPNRYLPLLQGSFAHYAWQITRAHVWAALGIICIRPLFSAMGNYTVINGLSQDERTQDLAKTIKARSLERMESMRQRRSHQPQPSEVQHGQQGQTLDQNPDIAHEQISLQTWHRDFSSRDDSETHDSRETRDSRPAEPISPPARGHDNVQSLPNRSTPPPNGDVFFYDDDDDASPTAGNKPRPESQAGSTWDRIRKGESSGPLSQQAQKPGYPPNSPPSTSPRGWRRPGAQPQQDAQFENSADSFSFSKTEADKQFAREQAQKEFDEMLDRERRQSGSDDYDRGMKAVESGQENQANSGMSAWEQRRRRN